VRPHAASGAKRNNMHCLHQKDRRAGDGRGEFNNANAFSYLFVPAETFCRLRSAKQINMRNTERARAAFSIYRDFYGRPARLFYEKAKFPAEHRGECDG